MATKAHFPNAHAGKAAPPVADQVMVALLGLVTLMVQVTLIRQLLVLFAGNELYLGAMLPLWLVGFGCGSTLGGRWFGGRQGLALVISLSAVLLPLTVLYIRSAHLLFGVTPGALLLPGQIVLMALLSIVPTAVILGLQYPLAVSMLGGDDRAASRAYRLEAFGAFAGGLIFVFFVSTRVDGVTLSILAASSLALIMARLVRSLRLALVALIPLVLQAVMPGSIRAPVLAGYETLQVGESRFGELRLLRKEGQYSLFRSGEVLLSFPDAETDEWKAHTAMSLHSAPLKVLLISDSPGVLRELLRYPDVQVEMAIDDPAVLPFIDPFLTADDRQAMASPAVSLRAGDGRYVMATAAPGTYDLILSDIPPPVTALSNRFFTTEFFGEARRALRPEGIIVLRGIAAPGYLGPAARSANQAIRSSLGKVFPHTNAGSMESGLLAASSRPFTIDPEALRSRFESRNIRTRVFHGRMFEDLFGQWTRPGPAEGPAGAGENTDDKPVALRFNLLHLAELQKSDTLKALIRMRPAAFILALCLFTAVAVSFCFRSSVRAAMLATGTTGFSGMGLSAALILGFQARFGHVYETLALLSASFMLGAAIGAGLGYRWMRSPRHDAVFRTIGFADLTFALLLLATPLVTRTASAFHLTCLAAGVLSGGQFSLSAHTVHRWKSGDSYLSRLYGIDLFGSALGGLIGGFLLVPLAGMKITLFLLAFVKTGSALCVLLVRNPKPAAMNS